MRKLNYQEIFSKFPSNKIYFDFPMKELSSFRVGGLADILLFPSEVAEIKEALVLCQQYQIPVQVLGNASNVLISDKGIRGLTIYLQRRFNKISVMDNTIFAQAGASLAQLAALAASKSLSGLEFAAGIPGSLGGAVLMNASAYDGETKNLVKSSTYLDQNNEMVKLEKEDHQFSYRHSFYSDKEVVIVQAELELEKGDRLAIYEKMNEFQVRRRASQPLEKFSGGSAFKRPEGYFAGKLISDAGLRGYRDKFAGVSDKHAGFIVNHGGASASEINQIFALVKTEVKKQFDVELEPEVKWLGEWDKEDLAWKL